MREYLTSKNSALLIFELEKTWSYYCGYVNSDTKFSHCKKYTTLRKLNLTFYADCHSGRGILFSPCPQKTGMVQNFSGVFLWLIILHRTQNHQPQKFCLSLSLFLSLSIYLWQVRGNVARLKFFVPVFEKFISP